MDDNENKKSNEALTDEALDKVAGGTAREDIYTYFFYAQNFEKRNTCMFCNSNKKDNCPKLLGQEGLYQEFDGDPNATCPYKT